MSAQAQVTRYMTNHYDGMSPEQLILLLFKGALDRIEKTRQGIRENNIQKRGENLSKVIAIVSELNASLNSQMNDETTRFLRGLYLSILVELPKVSLTGDIGILDRTDRYITGLKDIWETDVMGKTEAPKKPAIRPVATPAPRPAMVSGGGGYGSGGYTRRFNAIAV